MRQATVHLNSGKHIKLTPEDSRNLEQFIQLACGGFADMDKPFAITNADNTQVELALFPKNVEAITFE